MIDSRLLNDFQFKFFPKIKDLQEKINSQKKRSMILLTQ